MTEVHNQQKKFKVEQSEGQGPEKGKVMGKSKDKVWEQLTKIYGDLSDKVVIFDPLDRPLPDEDDDQATKQ